MRMVTIYRVATELERSTFGFEIDRNFYARAKDEMLVDYLTQ